MSSSLFTIVYVERPECCDSRQRESTSLKETNIYLKFIVVACLLKSTDVFLFFFWMYTHFRILQFVVLFNFRRLDTKMFLKFFYLQSKLKCFKDFVLLLGDCFYVVIRLSLSVTVCEVFPMEYLLGMIISQLL